MLKGAPCGEEFCKNTIIRRLKCIGLIILVDCFQSFHHHPIPLSRFHLVKIMSLINYNGKITTKSRIPEYRVWQQIRDRCKNKNNKSYKYYGGRGIGVCDRWLVFENFIQDMGYRPENSGKMTIERVNTNGDYEPNNCIWATYGVQGNNKRKNRKIEYCGSVMSVAGWARELGLSRQCMGQRIKRHGEIGAIEIGYNLRGLKKQSAELVNKNKNIRMILAELCAHAEPVCDSLEMGQSLKSPDTLKNFRRTLNDGWAAL